MLPTKSVSLIFKKPIEFLMYLFKNKIFHTYTLNRAQRGLVDAKIYTEINAPLQQQRRPRFKIGRLGLRGGANLALAVDEWCLGGPETPIRARKGSGLAEISAI